jgi:hypothetical protein
MIERMISALGARIKDADPVDLAILFDLAERLDAVTGDTIRHMNSHQLMSWAKIAQVAGITRQAAWERWSRPPAEPPSVSNPA